MGVAITWQQATGFGINEAAVLNRLSYRNMADEGQEDRLHILFLDTAVQQTSVLLSFVTKVEDIYSLGK